MEELTLESMPEFTRLLCELLTGREFTFCSLYRTHENVRLKSVSEIMEISAGVWRVYLEFEGGLGTQLGTEVRYPGGEPTPVDGLAGRRSYYRFTEQMLVLSDASEETITTGFMLY